MKITFLSPTLNMGGGTKILHIYAEALAQRGHDVLVVSTPSSKPSFLMHIKHFVKHMKRLNLTDKHGSFFDNSIAKHKVLESSRPIVDADLPDADVVIATWWETAEWTHALSPSKGKKVYFVQGHEVFDYLPVERVKKTYYYSMQKIAVSKWLGDIMTNEYGDKNCIVVPNSIDHKQFYAENRHKNTIPTVGFLYSNSYIKGIDTTLKAIKLLKQSIPNLRVVSFGTHRPDKNTNWDNSIEFYESPEQHSIRDLYSQCDVWLTASLSEGFNLTAMEAMACGTPVISTKTGWPVDTIKDGVNGYLIELNDNQTMFKNAKKILQMPDVQWKVMSEEATNTVVYSSWDTSIKLFESILIAR